MTRILVLLFAFIFVSCGLASSEHVLRLTSSSGCFPLSSDCSSVYKSLVLSNGIKVFLLSNPAANVSSVGFDVNIGHLHDPPTSSGLVNVLCNSLASSFLLDYDEKNSSFKYEMPRISFKTHLERTLFGSISCETTYEHSTFSITVPSVNLPAAAKK